MKYMTIDDIFNQFLTGKKDVRKSTMATYALCYRTHIQATFGAMEPDDVTSGFIQKWVDGMSGSPRVIRDRFQTLRTIINWYRRSHEQPLSQFRVNLPHSDKKEIEAYTREEQKKIVEYIREHPGIREFGILLCLSTGMRIGELCALQWQDMDLEKGELRVCKTLERIYDVASQKTTLVINPPKTISSRRTIPIPRELLKILKRTNSLIRPDYYVLSGSSKPIEPRVYRNFFNQLTDAAGVRRLKFHGLRHSFATLMVASKADIKTVSSILGHSGVGITMDIYVHPTIENKRMQMSKAFKGIL